MTTVRTYLEASPELGEIRIDDENDDGVDDDEDLSDIDE